MMTPVLRTIDEDTEVGAAHTHCVITVACVGSCNLALMDLHAALRQLKPSRFILATMQICCQTSCDLNPRNP